MARHNPKKKKKAPEEPVDAEKKDTPPPTEPIQTDAEKSYTKRRVDQLFWLRIGLAVMAGTAATFIFEPIEGEERRWSSIAFMIIIFLVSIGIGKRSVKSNNHSFYVRYLTIRSTNNFNKNLYNH